jgi:hypothetical protein
MIRIVILSAVVGWLIGLANMWFLVKRGVINIKPKEVK